MGRAVLPDYPHHIILRGHNRQVAFVEAGNFERYLETLADFMDIYGVKVYAWRLMTNHVHLLVVPQDMAGLGKLMKRLAGRKTRYHNRLERRSGTLCESRYKSNPVDSDSYLLACARYIELNPVRARMVASPEEYLWSSYRHRLGIAHDKWLDLDPCYLALGTNTEERRLRYSEFLRTAIPEGEWRLIREAVQRGQLTGTDRFVAQVETILGKRIENRCRGRPLKIPVVKHESLDK